MLDQMKVIRESCALIFSSVGVLVMVEKSCKERI